MIRRSVNVAARLAAFACAVLFCATTAHATVISADGLWHTFDVDDFASASGGLEWIDLAGDPLSFSFTTAGPVAVTILDGGFAGDRFEVFDHGTSLGLTSLPTDTYPLAQPATQTGFDNAFLDARWSRRTFVLGAGTYDISGLLSRSALDGGGLPLNATVGAIRVVAVPEPGTWATLLMGLTLLSVFTLRRRR